MGARISSLFEGGGGWGPRLQDFRERSWILRKEEIRVWNSSYPRNKGREDLCHVLL